VYELDANLKPIKHYYLGDQTAIEAAMKAVANQGKAKIADAVGEGTDRDTAKAAENTGRPRGRNQRV